MVHLTLPFPPSSNRYWRHARGKTYLSKEAKEYRTSVADLFEGIETLTGRVSVTARYFFPANRGDLDNRVKQLLDVLQGSVYTDDKQVWELHAVRFDDKKNPRVEVTVKAIR